MSLTAAATAVALARVASLTSSALTLLQAANQVSGILRAAHAEGREINDAELETVKATDDVARAALDKTIEDARAAG
jgi:hypothetical protein